MKKILIRHLGNMGDIVFFLPPVLETLKHRYPDAHITLVTAWGYKKTSYSLRPTTSRWMGIPGLTVHKQRESWGQRNQGGFSIHLLQTNPHIDQLIHYHNTKLDLAGNTCQEDGQSFPTWNQSYYRQQKASGQYDAVYELDFGIKLHDNPMQKMYEAINVPDATYSNYQLYFTERDLAVAQATISHYPRPRIVLLEGLEGTTTRGWDPNKIPTLTREIKKTYGIHPFHFGSKYVPFHEGRPLTLRENIARLTFCDVAIGVLSGPLHFAAAAGLPTLTLYGDQPLHRAAPSYFLNSYQPDPKKHHRTLLGPTGTPMKLLKAGTTALNLTAPEWKAQHYQTWQRPGRQATKSCVSVLTVEEVMTVLNHMLQ